jgi:hypothetical protein
MFQSVSGDAATSLSSQPRTNQSLIATTAPMSSSSSPSSTTTAASQPLQHRPQPQLQPNSAPTPQVGERVCAMCRQKVDTKAIEDQDHRFYHPDCFRCCVCKKALSQSYQKYNGKIYCMDDYRTALAHPCVVCNLPIVGDGMEDHKGNKYHPACFKCSKCGEAIKLTYQVTKEGKLFCPQCAPGGGPASGLADKTHCASCKGLISGAGTAVGVGDQLFHIKCFVCPSCKADMTSVPFLTHNGKLPVFPIPYPYF